MLANMAVRKDGSGARSISELMRKHWRFALSSLLGTILVMHRCCPTCSARSRQARRSAASPLTVPMIPASAMTRSLTAAPTPSYRLARTRSRRRPSPLVLSPETRPCGRRNILAVRSGETGADTTDEAVPKRTLSWFVGKPLPSHRLLANDERGPATILPLASCPVGPPRQCSR